jgi:lipopolysaccharide/colanic/teichoic acid biosynthesis glycosyltransferase
VSLKVKRAFDIVISCGVLLALSPVIIVVAFLIALRMGFPVFFRQTRPGFRGEPFEVIKFRTMRHAYDAHGELLSDKERLTPMGRALRRTSLDEIPQLWNVLKGDMSLVGPRPLLIRYMPYFTAHERKRFEVRPGITGWAQINGRNHSSWNQRLADDVWYVENWSLWLDCRILSATLKRIIRSEGVVSDPRSRMLDFDEERRGSIVRGSQPQDD